VEDTGLPRLLRDAQVLPIWEGTTNVLALDVLRALRRGDADLGDLEAFVRAPSARSAGTGQVARSTGTGKVAPAGDASLSEVGRLAIRAVEHARSWLESASRVGPQAVEAGARRFALTLGRAAELALLVEHASWCLARGDRQPAAVARRFAAHGVDLIVDD
jgi:hypothetical protein